MSRAKKKICFVSSSGGHWEELMCLREIADNHDSFFVTEIGGQVFESNLKKVYTFPQINRHEKFFLYRYIKLYFFAKKIIKEEKPDVIITTGALLAYPFCKLGKKNGSKIIFVESFARINDSSLTGKLVFRFADMFLVQWKELLSVYPGSIYVGGIF